MDHFGTIKAGDLIAAIGDNAASGKHRAGYNGVQSLVHKNEPDNLFVRESPTCVTLADQPPLPPTPHEPVLAPASVPLTWKELSDRIFADQYTVRSFGQRLASLKRDPWEGIASVRQDLVKAMKKLAG